jgi:hypothetical protein
VEATAATRSPLETGALVALAFLAFAGVVGAVAVLSADSDTGALGVGVGLGTAVFLNGATLAVALACLARGRAVPVALMGVGAAGTAVDLIALAALFEIEDETYAKLTAIASIWSFLALVVLGLVLAAPGPELLARGLKLAAVGAAALSGLFLTVLVLTAGGDDVVVSAGPFPVETFAEEELFRPLALSLVLLAPLWFAALAATRLSPRR